jgi:2-C-methyl-D-erythritol 4-phosphate cytidylyltransferase
MKVGAVIVAAGRGVRAGGEIPKQWRELAGATIARHAVNAFIAHPRVGQIIMVLHPDDMTQPRWPGVSGIDVVAGGATRSASVLAGLCRLEGAVDAVLIHDAARPCVSQDVISDVIAALESAPAAAPALAVVDALWTGADGRVTGVAAREGLFRAQTPQGFNLAQILDAHRQCPEGAADDVEIARRAGIEVVITPGDEDNLKVTTPADFARAEAILRTRHGH